MTNDEIGFLLTKCVEKIYSTSTNLFKKIKTTLIMLPPSAIRNQNCKWNYVEWEDQRATLNWIWSRKAMGWVGMGLGRAKCEVENQTIHKEDQCLLT